MVLRWLQAFGFFGTRSARATSRSQRRAAEMPHPSMPLLVRVKADHRELTTFGALFISVLAWSAGIVNAVGYLALGPVFLSHMTGNASAAILTLMTGHGEQLVDRVLAIASFFGGAIGGALLVETHREHRATGALWLEASVLLSAVLLAHGHPAGAQSHRWALIGVAGAMGVQNIALTGTALSAHTTHITGPLTDFAGTLIRRIVGSRQLSRDRSHGLIVYGGRVLAFVLGVASGAALFGIAGVTALLLPCAVVATAGVVLWTSANL